MILHCQPLWSPSHQVTFQVSQAPLIKRAFPQPDPMFLWATVSIIMEVNKLKQAQRNKEAIFLGKNYTTMFSQGPMMIMHLAL